ncbi:MAG: hypothetical protein OMM_14710, partial [Candidatus Magnetoglobus multicellularis str. Araruama]
MSEKKLDNLFESEKYFSILLEKDPSANRVKLELAEVLYRRNHYYKARNLLLEVKATKPPEKVGNNIDKLLAFINSGESKSWTAYAKAGLMYDTNANQGPSIDTVLMYGLPFDLDNDAKDNQDWALIFKSGIDYSNELNTITAIQIGLNTVYTDYFKLHQYDTLSLSISAGPGWKWHQWSFL